MHAVREDALVQKPCLTFEEILEDTLLPPGQLESLWLKL